MRAMQSADTLDRNYDGYPFSEWEDASPRTRIDLVERRIEKNNFLPPNRSVEVLDVVTARLVVDSTSLLDLYTKVTNAILADDYDSAKGIHQRREALAVEVQTAQMRRLGSPWLMADDEEVRRIRKYLSENTFASHRVKTQSVSVPVPAYTWGFADGLCFKPSRPGQMCNAVTVSDPVVVQPPTATSAPRYTALVYTK